MSSCCPLDLRQPPHDLRSGRVVAQPVGEPPRLVNERFTEGGAFVGPIPRFVRQGENQPGIRDRARCRVAVAGELGELAVRPRGVIHDGGPVQTRRRQPTPRVVRLQSRDQSRANQSRRRIRTQQQHFARSTVHEQDIAELGLRRRDQSPKAGRTEVDRHQPLTEHAVGRQAVGGAAIELARVPGNARSHRGVVRLDEDRVVLSGAIERAGGAGGPDAQAFVSQRVLTRQRTPRRTVGDQEFGFRFDARRGQNGCGQHRFEHLSRSKAHDQDMLGTFVNRQGEHRVQHFGRELRERLFVEAARADGQAVVPHLHLESAVSPDRDGRARPIRTGDTASFVEHRQAATFHLVARRLEHAGGEQRAGGELGLVRAGHSPRGQQGHADRQTRRQSGRNSRCTNKTVPRRGKPWNGRCHVVVGGCGSSDGRAGESQDRGASRAQRAESHRREHADTEARQRHITEDQTHQSRERSKRSPTNREQREQASHRPGDREHRQCRRCAAHRHQSPSSVDRRCAPQGQVDPPGDRPSPDTENRQRRQQGHPGGPRVGLFAGTAPPTGDHSQHAADHEMDCLGGQLDCPPPQCGERRSRQEQCDDRRGGDASVHEVLGWTLMRSDNDSGGDGGPRHIQSPHARRRVAAQAACRVQKLNPVAGDSVHPAQPAINPKASADSDHRVRAEVPQLAEIARRSHVSPTTVANTAINCDSAGNARATTSAKPCPKSGVCETRPRRTGSSQGRTGQAAQATSANGTKVGVRAAEVA